MIKLNVLIDKLIWLGTLALFCSFYILEHNSYNRFILLGITAGILILIVIQRIKKFPLYWHSFHSFMFLFLTFCFASYFWALNPIASLTKTATICQILICMSVLYIYYVRQKNITPLLDIIMWGGYILSLYAIYAYGPATIISTVSSAGRLNNDFTNVNTLGILSSLSIIISVYKVLFDRFKLYHLLGVLNLLLIAATGSRKALVLFVLGIGLVVLLKYSGKNFILSAVRWGITLCGLIILFKFMLSLSIFTTLTNRFDTLFNIMDSTGTIDNSTLLRMQMIEIGWEQFKQTPFLGVGIGNSKDLTLYAMDTATYLHNNYIELLACGGIIGTFLYYLLFLVPAWQLFKQRYSPDKNTLLCLIFIFLLLAMDWGSVSYYSKSTYFYIMMFFIQIKINTRVLKEKNYEISKQTN